MSARSYRLVSITEYWSQVEELQKQRLMNILIPHSCETYKECTQYVFAGSFFMHPISRLLSGLFKLPETPGSLTGLPSSWKPTSYLYKLKILCLTHNIFYGVCPEKLSSIVKKSPVFRNMRDNLKLIMESPNIH